MKKIFAILAVAFIAVASSFAMDLSAIQGTWKDANYDADWTFKANGTIDLSANSEVVFTFQDSNISDFKVTTEDNAVKVTFYCAETSRRYSFVKKLSLSTDVVLDIDRDWTDEAYETTMKMNKLF